MEDIKLIKPNKVDAVLLDYKLCAKNKSDWKNGYLRRCMLEGIELVLQEKMSDEDYYRLVMQPKFQYYLLDGDNVVGRALLVPRGQNLVDIQYLIIEEEFRGKGYGTRFFEMLEAAIFKDDTIDGILIEDASKGERTSAIAKKLGYEEYESGMFIKYKNGIKNCQLKK